MNRNYCLTACVFCVLMLSYTFAFAQVTYTLNYVSQTPDTLYLELQVRIAPQAMPGFIISNYDVNPWWGVAVDDEYPNWPHETGSYQFCYEFGSTYYFPIVWPITVGEGLHSFQAYIFNEFPQSTPIAVGEPILVYITDQCHNLVKWDLEVVAANELGLNLRLIIYNLTDYPWSMSWPSQPIACFSINNRLIMGPLVDEPITISVASGQIGIIPIHYTHSMGPGVYRLEAFLISPFDAGLNQVGGMETVTIGNVQDLEIGAGDTPANQPIDFYWANSLYECIYGAEDLDGIHGQITSLALYNQFSGGGLDDVPLKVYLGNTLQTDLSDGWIPSDQLSLVFDGKLNFPDGTEEILFNLDVPFTLNQGNNLVMMIQHESSEEPQTDKLFLCQDSDAMNGRLAANNTTAPDPTNPPASAMFTGKTPKLDIWYILGVNCTDDLAPSLHQARVYPNPFNQSSTLDFYLKDADQLTICVYNLKGQLVNTLHRGHWQAGEHSLSWDGSNEKGKPVANGIYFYRISGSKHHSVHRCILIR